MFTCKECKRTSTHKPNCTRSRPDIGATAVTTWDAVAHSFEGYISCGTCDGGGCPDCTDRSY